MQTPYNGVCPAKYSTIAFKCGNPLNSNLLNDKNFTVTLRFRGFNPNSMENATLQTEQVTCLTLSQSQPTLVVISFALLSLYFCSST